MQGLHERLTETAKDCRRTVLGMVRRAQSAHISSNFSVTEIMTALYEGYLTERDELILSKGWAVATLYYFLVRNGTLPKEAVDDYCKPGSKYIGLAEPMPGIPFAGGSVGMGLAAGVGFALARKARNERSRVVVVESDGGMNVGMTWESAMIAAHHKLDNLILIIDCNGLQAMGKTSEVLEIEPLYAKMTAFGWHTVNVDGHDMISILEVLNERRDGPLCIIAKTDKGKGVKEFEDDPLKFHYWKITDEVYERALTELT